MRSRIASIVGGASIAVAFACGGSDAGSPPEVAPGDDASTDASTAETSAPDGGACGAPVTPAPGLVVSDRGAVHGALANGAYSFLGIPYAAPPVGALRWKPPAPHACWPTPLEATTFGSMCLQLATGSTTSVVGAEDCLVANVWTPANATLKGSETELILRGRASASRPKRSRSNAALRAIPGADRFTQMRDPRGQLTSKTSAREDAAASRMPA